MSLTSEEKLFLSAQHIGEEEVFDATSFMRADAREIMKTCGIDFMIGSPCREAGHRLRTRAGHCIQCDTQKIAFQRRYSTPAIVYVAHTMTGQLVKVGSALDIERRINILNNQSYGSFSDWRSVFWIGHKEAGRIEQTVHQALRAFQVRREYFKQGTWQSANELFSCAPKVAVEAIQRHL
jgi:hypothetical protein